MNLTLLILGTLFIILLIVFIWFTLYITYLRFGYCKKIFHNIFHLHNSRYRNSDPVGTYDTCMYCDKLIRSGMLFWKEV